MNGHLPLEHGMKLCQNTLQAIPNNSLFEVTVPLGRRFSVTGPLRAVAAASPCRRCGVVAVSPQRLNARALERSRAHSLTRSSYRAIELSSALKCSVTGALEHSSASARARALECSSTQAFQRLGPWVLERQGALSLLWALFLVLLTFFTFLAFFTFFTFFTFLLSSPTQNFHAKSFLRGHVQIICRFQTRQVVAPKQDNSSLPCKMIHRFQVRRFDDSSFPTKTIYRSHTKHCAVLKHKILLF